MGWWTSSWPLVGRDVELDEIDEALRSGRSVVISGVPGVGKTRLARAVVERADGRGIRTHWAAGSLSARPIPLGALAALVPPSALTEPARPEALLRAMVASLAGEAGTPVVVGVDDAHLLDDASAALVQLLASRENAAAVITVRAGEESPDAVRRLAHDGAAVRFDVQELAEPDVAQLLAEVLEGPIDRATVRRLWSITRGNPLFLRELQRVLLDAGALLKQSGWWVWSGRMPSGATTGSLIEDRLSHLDEDARDALELVSFGEPLGLALVEELTGTGTIERLEREGLVEVSRPGADPEVRTSHPLYGEVVRATTPVSRGRTVRRLLAAAWSGQSDPASTDVLRAALWQLDAGGDVDDRVLVAAARQAWISGDPPLAERLAREALGSSVGHEAAYVLGEALADLSQFDAALTQWSAITDDAPAGVRVAAACSRAQVLRIVFGRVDDAISILDRTTSTVDDPQLRRTLLSVRVALGERRHFADRQREVAELLDQPITSEAEVWALLAILPRELSAGRIMRVEEQLPRARAAAAAAAHAAPNARMWVGLIATMVDVHRGRLDAAEATAQARLDAALDAEPPLERACWTECLGIIALCRGEARRAVALLEEAAMLHRGYARGSERGSLLALAHARAMGGDASAAAEALEAGERLAGGGPFQPLDRNRPRVWCRLAAGETSAAVALALEAADRAGRQGRSLHELTLLHDAARLGAARAVHERVVTLTGSIGGPWAQAIADHVTGMARNDPTALESAAAAFAAQGFLLEASEAWDAAAGAASSQGQTAMALGHGRRAEALRAACVEAGAISGPARRWQDPLTNREREVATLASKGLADKEVAARLGISLRTVHAHLRAVYAKLGIEGRGDLTPGLGDVVRG